MKRIGANEPPVKSWEQGIALLNQLESSDCYSVDPLLSTATADAVTAAALAEGTDASADIPDKMLTDLEGGRFTLKGKDLVGQPRKALKALTKGELRYLLVKLYLDTKKNTIKQLLGTAGADFLLNFRRDTMKTVAFFLSGPYHETSSGRHKDPIHGALVVFAGHKRVWVAPKGTKTAPGGESLRKMVCAIVL